MVSVLVLCAGCTTGKGQAENNPQVISDSEQSVSDSEDVSAIDRVPGGKDISVIGATEIMKPPGDSVFTKKSTYTWEEITVFIPDAWEGKYKIEESERGFSFLQTASAEKEPGMGWLCGFYREDGMLIDIAGTTPLAYTDTQTYYMGVPTDVNFYYEDAAISEEYQEMYEFVYDMAASLKIDKAGVQYNPQEFVFPLSSTVLLEEDDLWNYDDNSLAIARNEIYARHGRQFDGAYLAAYFSSCSWYNGTVPAKDFDEAALSQIEKDNIQAIKKAEDRYKAEHPYPKEYKEGTTAAEDVDADGQTEQIQFVLTESNQEYEGRILIDGQEFSLRDYDIFLDAPLPEFYITDISPHFEGLEIAVLDYGPSDDPVTYFFTCQSGLTYIGYVSGFPFKQLSGYNGFANGGNVSSPMTLDFTHTSCVYGSWWYDYDNQKLEFQDTGFFRYVPGDIHQLYEDIVVYKRQDENASRTVLPAQENVSFIATDGKEWILLRGKDGTEGYLRIVDGKIAENGQEMENVFSDMFFSG